MYFYAKLTAGNRLETWVLYDLSSLNTYIKTCLYSIMISIEKS